MKRFALFCALLTVCASASAVAPAKAKSRKAARPAAVASSTKSAAATTTVHLTDIQVTATRDAESTQSLPAHVTVVSGDDLRARGVTDLRGAMALVAGVDVSPSGDGGPAGSIPALWGFREFDAFLLVVDDVPAGGAFNPSLTTIDFNNVERIEVMRGAAPVMYGATSFVGVIHVIHYAAGKSPKVASIGINHRGSVIASASTVLSSGTGLNQSITANVEHRELIGERNGYNRGQLSYRGALPLADGKLHFDANITENRQQVTQTVRRRNAGNGVQRPVDEVGPTPLDANHNPSDAHVDNSRYSFTAGYELPLSFAQWATTLSYARTDGNAIRGFLSDPAVAAGANNARGFTALTGFHDLYLDSHLEIPLLPELNLVTGVDYLYGNADVNNTIFNYTVNGDGTAAQSSAQGAVTNVNVLSDTRHFAGLYAQSTWHPVSALEVLIGLRLNSTTEFFRGQKSLAAAAATIVSRVNNETGLSGMAGLSYRLWQDGADQLTVYGDYRDTYKPFALDMGPKAAAVVADDYGLQQPEEAYATEAGFRGSLLGGDLNYDINYFQLDFTNAASFAGGGVIFSRTDGGKLRFQGGELEADYRFSGDLHGFAHYAYHFSHFLSANTDDGTDVSNKQLELSPRQTAGLGLLYAPKQGFNASMTTNYIGTRFLNKKNTGPLTGYITGDASVGYRWHNYSLSLNGTNLSDQRDIVSESEFSEEITGGAAAYYRNPAREFTLTFGVDFN